MKGLKNIRLIAWLATWLFIFIPRTALAASGDSSVGVFMGFSSLVGIAVIGYIIYANSTVTEQFSTSQSFNSVKDAAVHYMGSRKFFIRSQSENVIVFARDTKASCLITGILLLIWVVPGLLYALFAGKTEVVTVSAVGPSLVQIRGKRMLVNAMSASIGLHQAMTATTIPVSTPSTLPQPPPIVAEAEIVESDGGAAIKNCEQCGKVLKEGDAFCAGCGAPIPAIDKTAVEDEEEAGSTVCPECGSEIEEGDKFCPSCGYKH
ncbi:MAG: zinc ribbon domain-containing protein [Actinomycetota bacterium]